MVSTPKSAKQLEDEKRPQVAPEEKLTEAQPPEPLASPVKVGELLQTLPDRTPAHWSIVPADDEEGIVIATCTTSRTIFRGTVVQFNAALRNQ